MDDIVVGVDSKKQAIEVISSISDMLKSRGLALNVSKTQIYNEYDGFYHFQIEENRYIDSIEKTKKTDADYKKFVTELHKRFKKHFKNQGAKYWDKITKRYITTFGRLDSMKLLNDLTEIYIEYPGLRQNLIYYMLNVGYCKKAANNILKIIKNIDVFDDISLYQLCYLVTQWEVSKDETF